MEARTALGFFSTLESNPFVIAEANALGVHHGRTTQNVATPETRPTAVAYAMAGMGVILHTTNGTVPLGMASKPLADDAAITTFKAQLGAHLDKFKPALLAIGNEENWSGYYTGTPQQYLTELAAAVEVAHAHDILVTNGGINSPALAILVFEDYIARGLPDDAGDFAARAFAVPQLAWVLDDLKDGELDAPGHPQFLASVVAARALVPAYAQAPIDYVNFHWYIDDEQALGEAIDYLGKATGKPLVSTEIGQGTIDGDVVTAHLQTLVTQQRLPFVVWYDEEGSAGAVGLHEPDMQPPALRPNGEAFAKFVSDHPDLLQ